MARRPALLPLFLAAPAGCGDATGLPQPDPVPKVSLIRTSRSRGGMVEVVGLPESVAGAGTVTIESAASQVSAPSGSAGSFTLAIAANPDEQLKVRYNASASATVQVPPIPPPSVPVPPGPIAGVPPVSDAGGGRVLVRGQTSKPAPSNILGTNPTLGEVVLATPAADRTFSVEIRATSGQGLRVFDDTGGPLEEPWLLVVP